jgi:hypothetical protein
MTVRACLAALLGLGFLASAVAAAQRDPRLEALGLVPKEAIAFLDPKRFRERYTVYVVPVADWDALLKATAGEEIAPGQYALTGAVASFIRGRYGRDYCSSPYRRVRGLAWVARSRAVA